jgi:hypothetical protein
MTAYFAQRAVLNIQVAAMVADANEAMRLFALLAVTWYGAGRAGGGPAPRSAPACTSPGRSPRLDYFLGKFLTVAFFGALASLVPGSSSCFHGGLVVPALVLLKEEGEVVWQTVAYSSIWITVVSSIVLCASSLVRRKTLALAGGGVFRLLRAEPRPRGRAGHGRRALRLRQPGLRHAQAALMDLRIEQQGEFEVLVFGVDKPPHMSWAASSP